MNISKTRYSGLIAALAVCSLSMGASAAPLIVGPGGSATISTSTVIDGTSSNEGIVDIQSPLGALTNFGTLNNFGTLDNDSLLDNRVTLTNRGTLNNTRTLDNSRDLNNFGTLNNSDMLNNSDTLTNRGTLDNSGTLDTSLLLSNWDTLNNSGTLNNFGSLDNYDTLDNAGTLDNTAGGTLSSYNTLENSGTLDNTGTLYNYGGLNNSGTVTVETIGRVDGTGTFTQAAGQTTVNGTMTQRSVAINGGTLGGSGTVTAALSVGAAGTVGPGNSPGLLQVFGDADFLAGSTLAVELGGLAFGTGYDRLDVADDVATTGVTEGTVSLADGTVFDIDWFGAFTAGDGDFFDVLVADEFAPFNLLALIFDFSDAALGTGLAWETSLVDFGGGREALRLSVTATQTGEIPAPGVILIFALGLAGLGFARRKRAA